MDFESWRRQARDLLVKGISPNSQLWEESQGLLFEATGLGDFQAQPVFKVDQPKVPRDFLDLAEYASYAHVSDRWDLLYRILFRLHHENAQLLNVVVDDDIRRLQLLNKSVRRDIHKMHAFVRFKKTEVEGVERYVAWHQAEHFIIKPGSPFFVRRFGDKPWSIFTPYESAHWDLHELTFGEGMPQHQFEVSDSFDEIWKTYYKSIYNPARLKIKAMKAEMAPKYWNSLPEAEIIRDLIRQTPKRLQDMAEQKSFLAHVPLTDDWSELKEAARNCQACPLFAKATQTVFGEGSLQSPLMIVGEQPGDEEDLGGRNFIGPAGQILNEILTELRVERKDIYITNAVKHFKWQEGEAYQGKARIHKRASGQEMHACKPWLEAEISKIQPRVIIALGVTAGTALWGRLVQIQKERGQWHTKGAYAPLQILSWHPSAILRAPTIEDRESKFQQLKEDLRLAVAKAFNDI